MLWPDWKIKIIIKAEGIFAKRQWWADKPFLKYVLDPSFGKYPYRKIYHAETKNNRHMLASCNIFIWILWCQKLIEDDYEFSYLFEPFCDAFSHNGNRRERVNAALPLHRRVWCWGYHHGKVSALESRAIETAWMCQRHWNENVVILTKFPSLAALKVVVSTTFSVASDENFIKMTFPFHWTGHHR